MADDEFQVDLHGLAVDLEVKDELVATAAQFLESRGLVAGFGTFGKNTHTGHFWITTDGVAYVESQGLPVEAFLSQLYEDVLGRVSSLGSDLRAHLEALRAAAVGAGQSSEELAGYANGVRLFVEDLTQRLYEQAGLLGPVERNKTVFKVTELTKKAASDTSRNHVRALAEVVETHWRRLNSLQAGAVHAGTVEAQRLFAYTVLFVADLFDVLDG